MGEYADMAIDDALHWHVEELAYPDDYDGMDGFSRRRYRKMSKTCKSCGASNLYWYKYEGQWLLHELNINEGEFVPHSCKLKNAFKKKV